MEGQHGPPALHLQHATHGSRSEDYQDMAWSDIPTCKDQGLPIQSYQMPRTIWLPAGVPSDAVEFYTGVLRKSRNAGVESLYRALVADRYAHDRRYTASLYQAGSGARQRGL